MFLFAPKHFLHSGHSICSCISECFFNWWWFMKEPVMHIQRPGCDMWIIFLWWSRKALKSVLTTCKLQGSQDQPLFFLLEHTNLKKNMDEEKKEEKEYNMEGLLWLEHLQRVLGFASEMKLSFDRHHTCHCIHWSGVGVGISGLLLTPRPQDWQYDMDLEVIINFKGKMWNLWMLTATWMKT